MPWQVEFNEEWNCIHSVFSGKVTKKEADDATVEALSLAQKDAPNLFLTDVTNAISDLSIVDIYNIPGEWSAAGANRANKLAVIVPDDGKLLDDMRFYETACRNRGWQVVLFFDQNEALKWLNPELSDKP